MADATPPLTADEARKLPLNCPYCGQRLRYVKAEGGGYLYRCARDGWMRLTDRGLHPEPH